LKGVLDGVSIPPPPPKAYLQTVPLLVKVSTAGRSMLLMGVNSFDRAMSREMDDPAM